ncbi:hypothetical protein [Pseudodesulfovibrio profundus]|uniref:hypothetical protein n=1 Tax=Pseudodesulfovibrio profundus TaxID=57320 RepID=UPI00138FE897|nr:hypothetical protein [Pseudodesulfovibrio profundus]
MMLAVYSLVAFWGKCLKGIHDRVDIANYIRVGLDFWDYGSAALSGAYANNGFSILVGLIAKLSGINEPYIITLVLGIPCFLGTLYFFFRIFEFYLGEVWATVTCLFLSASYTFTSSLTRPLSEVPFILVISWCLYLTIVKNKHPFLIGLILGASFWIRNQTVIFLPIWPLLLNSTKDLKSYVKNGFLLTSSFTFGVVSYFSIQGGMGFFYSEHSRIIPSFADLLAEQYGKLNKQNSVIVYLLGVASILFGSVRFQAKRLYLFTTVGFFLQLALILQKGWTTRPGTYVLFFVLYAFLITVFIKNDVWISLQKKGKKGVLAIAFLCFTVFLVANSSLGRIGKALLTEGYTQRALIRYKIDRSHVFDQYPSTSTIATDTTYGSLWTKLSARKHNVLEVLPREHPQRMENLFTNDPFSASIDIINARRTPLDADFLAVWRTGNTLDELFPSRFVDRFGNQFSLVAIDDAPSLRLALYRVNHQQD